ncbi:hypothetical protein BDK51DRAFT_27944 [Blyttiomyces helicus]|uniref:Uncharacterized protein n=1 Tax=Blyttiomyces helicus TaxID=388810 RepID=A0A4P9WLC4_9FUNG|nr:hypothetical protein BDK51DRAFT_27944 [Blyttiomyces helicus]|eukprot:RKO91920.1 hypothetical protein BDK51DRAFT_27944 [Blyttiomyces helicus]
MVHQPSLLGSCLAPVQPLQSGDLSQRAQPDVAEHAQPLSFLSPAPLLPRGAQRQASGVSDFKCQDKTLIRRLFCQRQHPSSDFLLTRGTFIGGSLNPGPFNIKEHTLIMAAASTLNGATYATDRLFYDPTLNLFKPDPNGVLS